MTGEAVPGDAASAGARVQLGLPDAAHEDGGRSVTVDRLVTFAFVMSLCGILIWGCALVGLILGLVARRSLADLGAPKRKMATASIVIGAIPVGVGVVVLLAAAVVVASSG